MHIAAFSPASALADFVDSYELRDDEATPGGPGLLRHPHPTSEVVEAVANCILRRRGRVTIEALAYDAGLSRRQLERRFLLEVGAPPKLYARIARFNHVLELLAESLAPDWPDIAYLCGYYDQAHLIREFRRFTGQTPGAYARHCAAFVAGFYEGR